MTGRFGFCGACAS